MKKQIILLLFGIMISMNSAAQQNGGANEAKGFSFGAEAGMTINNYTSADRLWREGFYLGARGKYNFNDLYLAASLRLIRKGADAFDGESDSDDFYQAYYLEVPVMVGGQWHVGRKVSLFGELGPYMALGIGGNSKGKVWSDGSTTVHYDWKFFSSDNDNPRRFDAGVGVRCGVAISKVEISLGYERGFVPVWKNDKPLYPDNNYNSSFMIGLGYMF